MSLGFPAFLRQFWLHFKKNFKKYLEKEYFYTNSTCYFETIFFVLNGIYMKCQKLDWKTSQFLKKIIRLNKKSKLMKKIIISNGTKQNILKPWLH